jgi:hypothetical protein
MAIYSVEVTDGVKAADGGEIVELENYAKALFDKTCEAVRTRTAMSPWERKAFEAHAANLADSLNEIGEIAEKRFRLAAMRATVAALALGFYHAGNGEVVAGVWSKLGREGGKKSGASRKANRPWASHAADLAQKASEHDPRFSDSKIATWIEGGWKLGKCPGHRTLEGFISYLRKDGKLPQRSGSFQKQSG